MITVAQERLVRHAAPLGLHERITTSCTTFELVPLTLRKLDALAVLLSPYLPPFKTPTAGDTIAFLWILSPQWQPGNSGPAVAARKKFLRRNRFPFVPPLPPFWRTLRARGKHLMAVERARVAHAEVVTALREFMLETYQDVPGANPGTNWVEPPQYYSDSIAISCDLAREYGGGFPAYLDLPLKLVFQAMKEVREYRAAKVGRSGCLENPSDAAVEAELDAANRALHASGKKMHPAAVAYFQARNN